MISIRLPRLALFCGLLASTWSSALSSALAASYDESVQGDLSGAPESPTPLVLEVGANTLTGSAGPVADQDFDLLAFTVPAGYRLDSLVLDKYELNSGLSFAGLAAGSTWPTGLGHEVSSDPLIGWALFDVGVVGVDILTAMDGVYSPPRFSSPLPAGAYTLELQDTTTAFNYGFTFNMSAVPEPSTALLLSGIIGGGLMRGRRAPAPAGMAT